MRSLTTLETALKAGGKGAGKTTLAYPYGGGLVVLIAQGMLEPALQLLSESNIPCGVGEERPLLEVPTSLEQARLAATASALLYGSRPVCYANLGVDRLLILLYKEHADELANFVESTIGPLLQHDAGSAAPMLPTLEAFVAHGGRLRETAAELSVHRNTLAYRLDRTAEILGVYLHDPGTRQAVELAIRALPLVR